MTSLDLPEVERAAASPEVGRDGYKSSRLIYRGEVLFLRNEQSLAFNNGCNDWYSIALS